MRTAATFQRKEVVILLKPLNINRNVPSSFLTHEQQNIDKVNETLKGVELSPAEEKTLLWLCGRERSTVNNICSIFEKLKGVPIE